MHDAVVFLSELVVTSRPEERTGTSRDAARRADVGAVHGARDDDVGKQRDRALRMRCACALRVRLRALSIAR